MLQKVPSLLRSLSKLSPANKPVTNKRGKSHFDLTAKTMNILMKFSHVALLLTFWFALIITGWLWNKDKSIIYRINDK